MTNQAKLDALKVQMIAMMSTGPVSLSRVTFATCDKFDALDAIDAGAQLVSAGIAARVLCASEHTWVRAS